MHAQVVLLDGFDPLDVIAPYEVLYAGGGASAGAVSVELVSAEGPREVASGIGGLTVRATAALDPERAGVIVVPGVAGRLGEPGEAPERDAGEGKEQPEAFLSVLLDRAMATELAGLLEGRHATTHHMGLDALGGSGAHAVRARVVDDGDLVTGAGVTSGLDLGLYLLEREVGPRVAHAVEELTAHERRGVVWRDQGPAPVGF